jgi:Tfp pilus assembly protein PilV
MRKKLISNHKGISLLEVLIGMGIIAVGLLGFAPLIVLSVEGNVIARENSDAANLLKEKVEFYESLSSMPTVPFTESEPDLQGGFTRTTRIDDNSTDSLVPDGLYQINVQVAWVDNQNVQRASSYSTFLIK